MILLYNYIKVYKHFKIFFLKQSLIIFLYQNVHTGSEFFLVKYLVYFLKVITPFVSRSVAALLNISSETGSVVSPSAEVYFDLWFLLIDPLTS